VTGVSDHHGRRARATPVSARGEPAVWLTGGALLASLVVIIGIVVIIAWRGGATFLVRPIERVTLDDGTVFLGVPLEEEAAEGTQSDADPVMRRRYRVGNRDLGQDSFRWVDVDRIASIEHPADATMLERREWGVFIGEPRALFVEERRSYFDGQAVPESGTAETDDGVVRLEVEPVGTGADGSVEVLERRYLAEGADATWAAFGGAHAAAIERWDEIQDLNKGEVPRLQQALARLEWREREAEQQRARTIAGENPAWPVWAWAGACVLTFAGAFAAVTVRRRALGARHGVRRTAMSVAAVGLWAVTAAGMLGVATEHPWSRPHMSEARLAVERAKIGERRATLQDTLEETLERINELRAKDERYRVVFVEPTTGRLSPKSRSEPDEPMVLSQVVRAVRANELGFGGRMGVYLSRWWEYLSAEPRENGAEGGVFPVIVGTVTLTLLLTVAVVPLGVIAALYLREYAHQGLVTSLIRIAINNLAGVPSIVYGMFGLGFFCYGLGAWVDGGPAAAASRGVWWGIVAITGLIVVGGAASTMLAVHEPGKPATRVNRVAAGLSWCLWIGAVGMAVWLVARTPYFHGWFSEKLPERPTFGGRGILWAALTLALLTLPVVIVATEEAISAVPGSMREGSYASGASRWQTVRRIVLPAAMPGIMTGTILAMARGAGEVAPLMLVGAVNFTQSSPVTAEAPYLHGDRTFMHLGFHIYNLGFQSPDSQATEPLVWTTTLLLVTIVLVLNLAAIIIRSRLRGRGHVSGA